MADSPPFKCQPLEADGFWVRHWSLRRKYALMLILGVMTFVVVGYYGLARAQAQFVSNVSEQLATTADLEESRVEERLAFQLEVISALAANSKVQAVMADSGGPVMSEAAGHPEIADAFEQMLIASPQFLDLSVVGPDGVVASTMDSAVVDMGLVGAATSGPAYGEPYLGARDLGRVPVAAILNTPSDPGAFVLVADYDIREIGELVAEYENVGETWEAHIARRTDDGGAEFITRLRFEQDAAFTKVVPGAKTHLPIIQAVNGVEDVLVGVGDYRQVSSILALRTIEPTQWGLVVKADYDEAVAAFRTTRMWWIGATVVAAIVMLALGAIMFRALDRRVARFREVAEAVRAGDYARRIDDTSRDELGVLATEFDRATDAMARNLSDKARFVATVSHELRSPLTGVTGMAELIAADDGSLTEDDIRDLCVDISGQAGELNSLVEDLLTAASVQNGSLMVEEVDVAVSTLLVDLVAHLTEDTRNGLRVEIAPHLQSVGDPKRVRQIIRNLLSNAAKYGGGESVLRARAEADRVLISVSDNGPGVPVDAQERIFGAFQRGHDDPTIESVGLGLNISRELARKMDGELTYSRNSGWTTFTLCLVSHKVPDSEIRVAS